ncbi:glucosamine-6-phosphate deaminase [Clostridium algidicarnis]|uniref:Glucosamine-6-phosphate deaminase n=1 Tax=Clostridium algidicarnis TaxID=37659 RepID=A0ABS6C2H0_9CLOT|nr:glucosamine-6-phosphate deaminase [Clostridium algidicarnis]MBB6632360.1 glucosamine-6-phosphate deaminase [Clostridium algidicarnis]MBB6698039.1 glucosamine-6-phosphate deaminase [Clostridium algidicarnis]MBU3204210.1 glucosamine-6-phosphate deaminase [Clostridium algidicarnis]MBU3212706.1 glucosamine-6-phosphate deaminase [Clostridium algidicarnis]MBU3219678.1 glucosamine-6-phosphate deaminase [Clostridium algidicarnis]
MKLIIEKDYEGISKRAAKEISKVINNKEHSILGLATGSSPIGLYEELIKLNEEKKVDFSKVTTINLDEYIGISNNHPQSYRYFMNNTLFNHINIDKNNTYVPNGNAEDMKAECIGYDKNIRDLGGIDVQLLGIGGNGHIAFNEPDEELVLGTHVTGLTESTIKANSRFFDSIDEVPKKAITMGLGEIMKAKSIILIASGEGKAEAIAKLFSGKITTKSPATLLAVHNDVTVIIDEQAASLLNK